MQLLYLKTPATWRGFYSELFSCPNNPDKYREVITLGLMTNTLPRIAGIDIFSNLVVPRTASATRALLRLSPCHRT